RIIGYGLASLLVRLDILDNRNAAYPLGLLAVFGWLPGDRLVPRGHRRALLVWLPATLWLVRAQLRSREPWVGAAGFAASIFLLLFLGRVFQASYLLWPLTGVAIAGDLAAAQTASRPSTTNVEPRPGSESTEMRPLMRSTNSLLM